GVGAGVAGGVRGGGGGLGIRRCGEGVAGGADVPVVIAGTDTGGCSVGGGGQDDAARGVAPESASTVPGASGAAVCSASGAAEGHGLGADGEGVGLGQVRCGVGVAAAGAGVG